MQGIWSYDNDTYFLSFAPTIGLDKFDVFKTPLGGSPILCDALGIKPPSVLVLYNTTVTFDSMCTSWTGEFGGDSITWTAGATSLKFFVVASLILGVLLLAL